MRMVATTNPEVIIVGAGPVGLMLACELRLLGLSPVVLERLPRPTGLSKALGLQGRGIDLLEARGLFDRFLASGAPLGSFAHFAGIRLDVGKLGETAARSLFIQQARTEALLEARATELGVDLRRGQEVIALDQDDDGVTVRTSGDAGEDTLRARYLVGCDGAGASCGAAPASSSRARRLRSSCAWAT
ncbi:monooxygenase, FAD-binding protein [Minicystis rosea]|nr:monooxygenase, FAD-binding protein [Minicystis rosea]